MNTTHEQLIDITEALPTQAGHLAHALLALRETGSQFLHDTLSRAGHPVQPATPGSDAIATIATCKKLKGIEARAVEAGAWKFLAEIGQTDFALQAFNWLDEALILAGEMGQAQLH